MRAVLAGSADAHVGRFGGGKSFRRFVALGVIGWAELGLGVPGKFVAFLYTGRAAMPFQVIGVSA